MLARYRIGRLLGQGGFGAVYEALQTDLNRPVAIKVLAPAFAQDDEMCRRFFNEARAANAIRHDGIVEISDFGQAPDGRAFLVMELLQGNTLAGLLEDTDRRVGLRTVLQITQQVAAAMSAAHARQVIHRDLKPENIFLVRDPLVPGGLRVKVLDFGIAKLAQAAGAQAPRTRTGFIMGSPRYMAPEQGLDASRVTDKSDVYALGVILYELVTGEPPFAADSLPQFIFMHGHTPPPPVVPQPGCAELPEELRGLIGEMLEKVPLARPGMAEVARRLAALLEAAPPPRGARSGPATDPAFPVARVSSGPPISSMPPTLRVPSGAPPSTAPSAATAAPPPQSRVVMLLVGALLLLGGGVFGGWVAGYRRAASPAGAAAVPEPPAPVVSTPAPASVPAAPAPVAPAPAPVAPTPEREGPAMPAPPPRPRATGPRLSPADKQDRIRKLCVEQTDSDLAEATRLFRELPKDLQAPVEDWCRSKNVGWYPQRRRFERNM